MVAAQGLDHQSSDHGFESHRALAVFLHSLLFFFFCAAISSHFNCTFLSNFCHNNNDTECPKTLRRYISTNDVKIRKWKPSCAALVVQHRNDTHWVRNRLYHTVLNNGRKTAAPKISQQSLIVWGPKRILKRRVIKRNLLLYDFKFEWANVNLKLVGVAKLLMRQKRAEIFHWASFSECLNKFTRHQWSSKCLRLGNFSAVNDIISKLDVYF